ncbi:UDP-GlcNAc:undecaprenyl-phosphate GlcNAc-1-phosphate transferase [Virgibacillus natechei]|uniref:UDP-GlcNAc:undecaprenyl-phosphate GlcNAc-1-phosphate transferase n=1 Tax=Virgibacillus natechei TaxID=1216297 RepID=A0ABS4IFI2_9BACI|nr:MraY family glycosyltransferase [Virgibacillus natechei]MBP1969380.1 UDP-GlcNAc:undecaprenyl-phosphate GlcNAc-1-phosphate transferase [Virgibacillus natechei]UZD12524.1 undecaprenyl/decaprenyl-phosphate alpha-N-acetylglucosaminyl 1-phosphate transferase [Virgibacillus natechei]
MWNISELVIAFIISCLATLLVTPLIIKLSNRLKVVDKPDNNRKSHNGEKPSMGGIAIFIGAAAGFMYLQPMQEQMNAIIIGAFIMVLTGLLDDMFELRALYKLAGQVAAALVVVSSGLVIENLTIPFAGTVYMGEFGILLTVLWIVAASNAINLIDGLDGLAAGVSAIGLASILAMAIIDYQIVVVYLSIILIGSCIGFLFHNFHPAKIFMGDTGALFLGYSIAIVAMLGLFKNVAFFSFIVPIIVIAVPVFDTTLAIIRRTMNHQGIATADKQHIHYQLMNMGYSHRGSVLIIYAFSVFFGGMAIIFNSATLLTSLVIFGVIIIGIQLIAEIAGVTVYNRQPLLDGFRRLIGIRNLDKMK